MKRLIPLALLTIVALAWTATSYQPSPADLAASKTDPPAEKGAAIFSNANVITLSGPAFGSKTITFEGLPPGTTQWMKSAPTGGPPAIAGDAPATSPFFEGRTNDRLKSLEAQQVQILQAVLDLQKQLGKNPVPK